MKSTGYIIELLVAGAGTVLWLGILLLALFGDQWLPMNVVATPEFLIVASPFIYALGVIMDRNIDELFDQFRESQDIEKQEAFFNKPDAAVRCKAILEEANQDPSDKASKDKNEAGEDKRNKYAPCIEELVKRVEGGEEKVIEFSLPLWKYHEIRTKIMLASETLATQLEYYKIRLRICRTWAVNAFFTLIAANLWIILPHTPIKDSGMRIQAIIAITIVLGLSTWLAWRAWAQLTKKEIKFLWQQVRILKNEEAKK